MDRNETNRKQLWAWLIPLATGFVIMVITVYAAWFMLRYEIEIQKRAAQNELSVLVNRLETMTNRQIDMAQGLAVYYMDRPEADFEELTHFSEKLFVNQTEILKTVVLTKNTTVAFVYPLKGNESVLGVDLTTVSNQRDAVLQAKKTMRPVMTKPVRLIQGGMGIIFRVPQVAYKEGISENFVGLMNVVINYDRLLGSSGVLGATKQYDLHIAQQNDNNEGSTEIFYTTEKSLKDPIGAQVNLKENYWYIELAPIDGWEAEAYIYYMVFGVGLCLSGIVFFYLRSLLLSKAHLNEMVKTRTLELSASNASLETSLENLKMAQSQLIRSEKLAGLGELVAGVAHEINTPLGVGITLTSFLLEKHSSLNESFIANRVTRGEISTFFSDTSEALNVLDTSLHKAAEIVRSFKNVAVEQSSLELRTFNISHYLDDLLLSLNPKFKHTDYQIELKCPESLEITSYPGALSQILTQLINNSLSHGFQDCVKGSISIEIQQVRDQLRLVYADDGRGIPAELQAKVYNPFFTTDKQRGSTGLGLHIVHNLTTQILKGQIQLISEQQSGTQFIITFPI